MRVIVGQMVVTDVVLEMAAFPWDKGRQANHGMCQFSHYSIDDLPIRSILGNCGMTRIVTVSWISIWYSGVGSNKWNIKVREKVEYFRQNDRTSYGSIGLTRYTTYTTL